MLIKVVIVIICFLVDFCLDRVIIFMLFKSCKNRIRVSSLLIWNKKKSLNFWIIKIGYFRLGKTLYVNLLMWRIWKIRPLKKFPFLNSWRKIKLALIKMFPKVNSVIIWTLHHMEFHKIITLNCWIQKLKVILKVIKTNISMMVIRKRKK